MNRNIIHIAIAILISTTSLFAQKSQLIRIDIASPVSDSNFFNESATRQTVIYLPPSYETELTKRYPVVYLLAGFGAPFYSWLDGDTQGYHIQTSMDAIIANSMAKEMIVVAVDGLSFLDGSFYDNSEVTGNWEDYITTTLINYLDTNFRTIAHKDSRALAGHSMGGYGALNLSMKHPDIFSIGFGMSPGLFDENGLADCSIFSTQASIDTYFDIVDYLNGFDREEAHTRYIAILNEMKPNYDPNVFSFAYGSTFSPNINKNAPYFDYPYTRVGDELVLDTAVWQKWQNGYGNLKNKVEKYKTNLESLNAYVIDCGTNDYYSWIPRGCQYYSDLLSENNIPHILNFHDGDHGSGMKNSIENVLIPLCDSVLIFDTTKTYYFGQTPPTNEAKIFAPGIISLDDRFEQAFCYGAMDTACFISITDGYWSYFTITRKSLSDTGWSAEHTPGFLPANRSGLTPVFHPIENKVFFPSAEENGQYTDIFSSEKINGVWTTPEPCAVPINSNRSDWHLSFTNDGTMYFSSDRAGGIGYIDIYQMEYEDGEYSTLRNLDTPINTSESDCTPLISPDGDYMIIESTRSNSSGIYDIYVSFKMDNGDWYEPISLGNSVNTDHHDMAPSFSPDMKYLFFTRKDATYPSTFSDIYWVSTNLISEIKNSLPNGALTNTQTNTNNTLHVYPNPAQNTLYVSCNNGLNEHQSYTLFDITGKAVANGTITNSTIDVSHLTQGVYELLLPTKSKNYTQQIIIN